MENNVTDNTFNDEVNALALEISDKLNGSKRGVIFGVFYKLMRESGDTGFLEFIKMACMMEDCLEEVKEVGEDEKEDIKVH
jgi:hypothetical protein